VKVGGQQWLEQTHYLWCKLSTGQAESREASKLEDVGMSAAILEVCLQQTMD